MIGAHRLLLVRACHAYSYHTRTRFYRAYRARGSSWWKLLHFLEADGLTPPLKGTDLAEALFIALDTDGDGALTPAEAVYALSLLASGTPMERVDATCNASGAPAAGAIISRSQAMQQLQLCVALRSACTSKLAGLLSPSVGAARGVPDLESIEPALNQLYGAGDAVAAEAFRRWLVTEVVTAPLFASLAA